MSVQGPSRVTATTPSNSHDHTTETDSPVTTATFQPTFTSSLPKLAGKSFPLAGVTGHQINGLTFYTCDDCDYQHDRMISVRAHRAVHAERKPKQSDAKAEMPTGDEIAAALEVLQRVAKALPSEQPTPDDTWKTRAKDAERKLAAMRRALGVTA